MNGRKKINKIIDIKIGRTKDAIKPYISYSPTAISSPLPIATEAQAEAPILIRQPSMANKKVKELSRFIAARASFPRFCPASIVLTKPTAVVPKIASIVGIRYFCRVFLIK